MKKLFLSALLMLLFFRISPGYSAESVTLDSVLLRARDYNPGLVAAREAWLAKKAQVRPAGTWPNPELSFMEEKLPSGMEGIEPMRMRTYAIDQEIPFPGKLSAESKMVWHDSVMAESAYRDKIFEILKDVRLKYYELYMTDRRIALATESVGILQSSLRNAQSRLASASRGSRSNEASADGMGSASAAPRSGNSAADVFMIQTELRKMENMLFQAKQNRTLMQIELNALLNQPTETAWGPVRPPELQEIPVTLQDLVKISRVHAPLYRTAEHEARHSQALLRRSRMEFLPDLGIRYGKKTADAGPDGQEIEGRLSVPLWVRRPAGQIKEAKAHRAEAEANAQSMRTMVDKMVHMEYVQTQTHLTIARNFLSGILPPAQSNLVISRQRYASGQTDFLRLLAAFRSWIDAHDQYEEELYQYGEHWSELERWIGVELARAPLTLQHMSLGMEDSSHGK